MPNPAFYTPDWSNQYASKPPQTILRPSAPNPHPRAIRLPLRPPLRQLPQRLHRPPPASSNPSLNPPSHCPTCHHLIRWYDNIPIFSYRPPPRPDAATAKVTHIHFTIQPSRWPYRPLVHAHLCAPRPLPHRPTPSTLKLIANVINHNAISLVPSSASSSWASTVMDWQTQRLPELLYLQRHRHLPFSSSAPRPSSLAPPKIRFSSATRPP